MRSGEKKAFDEIRLNPLMPFSAAFCHTITKIINKFSSSEIKPFKYKNIPSAGSCVCAHCPFVLNAMKIFTDTEILLPFCFCHCPDLTSWEHREMSDGWKHTCTHWSPESRFKVLKLTDSLLYFFHKLSLLHWDCKCLLQFVRIGFSCKTPLTSAYHTLEGFDKTSKRLMCDNLS